MVGIYQWLLEHSNTTDTYVLGLFSSSNSIMQTWLHNMKFMAFFHGLLGLHLMSNPWMRQPSYSKLNWWKKSFSFSLPSPCCTVSLCWQWGGGWCSWEEWTKNAGNVEQEYIFIPKRFTQIMKVILAPQQRQEASTLDSNDIRRYQQ